MKIGIFGRRAQRDRPAIMRPAGWKTFNILPCQTGERARLIEQTVLQHLRDDLGLRPYLTNQDMPQNGGTETFSEDDITALQLWRLVWAKSIQETPDSQPSDDDNERPSPGSETGAMA